jgi:hypothetical protein
MSDITSEEVRSKLDEMVRLRDAEIRRPNVNAGLLSHLSADIKALGELADAIQKAKWMEQYIKRRTEQLETEVAAKT